MLALFFTQKKRYQQRWYKVYNKNSWVIPPKQEKVLHKLYYKDQTPHWEVPLHRLEKRQYSYFCQCGATFEENSKDAVCPSCQNEYFIDTDVWENAKETCIWKEFHWERKLQESEEEFSITLFYEIPQYNDEGDITFRKKTLLFSSLRKSGTGSQHFKSKAKIVNLYSFFVDDTLQPFRKLLVDDAKEHFLDFIFSHKTNTNIAWIQQDDLQRYNITNTFHCLDYFLRNTHLKELEFYLWHMRALQEYTKRHPTQRFMLEFILNHKKESSLKKALFLNYQYSLDTHNAYYPYSDYIFSRTIEDVNFLVQLLSLDPQLKQYLFTDENFNDAMVFMMFLQEHYTQKQITRLFVENMKKEGALESWRDTLRLLRIPDIYEYLRTHFQKRKLTAKNLHDEIIRIYHTEIKISKIKQVSLKYKPFQYDAEVVVDGLLFVLPKDTKELFTWGETLHNCIAGYANDIKLSKTIIYGVFYEEKLLYAIEINDASIVQANGKYNVAIDSNDMEIIQKWFQEHYLKNINISLL